MPNPTVAELQKELMDLKIRVNNLKRKFFFNKKTSSLKETVIHINKNQFLPKFPFFFS